MKLLVTGGAGFIGSNFIRYMLHHHPEYKITNLDALTYAGNLANLQSVSGHANYRFVHGDIADLQLVKGIFETGIDIVVNFAAESHVDRSIENPNAFVRSNVLGTQVLLEAARLFGVHKFIQISTDEVYGSLGRDGKFTESSPLAASSPYSASKAGADLLARSYYVTYGLPVVITRCTNNYGPYQHPEKLIPTLIIRALNEQPLPLYGDGQNVRDWLHVGDHCEAIDLVMHKGAAGEVYNIGGNTEKTNLEIARIILASLNKPESMIQFVEDRPGHDFRYALDASKISNELGWTPKQPFDAGLEATVSWFVENREWWENDGKV